MKRKNSPVVRSTTVLLVRRDNHIAMAGDGQVTVGETVMKASARKVRRLYNDKILRHLEALLVVADEKSSFLLSGNGDVISPDDGVLAIGSGGSYALAAARALMANTQMSARDIALEAMRIAGDICIYSNSNIIVEEL